MGLVVQSLCQVVRNTLPPPPLPSLTLSLVYPINLTLGAAATTHVEPVSKN